MLDNNLTPHNTNGQDVIFQLSSYLGGALAIPPSAAIASLVFNQNGDIILQIFEQLNLCI
jgi:hypothetical protein